MKKLAVLSAMTLSVVLLNVYYTNTANGRPDYFKQFQAHYKESKVLQPAKKAKCNNCHYGKKKKNRNDYGTALSKHLTKDMWKNRRKDMDGFKKQVSEALTQVEKVKSSSGETFGALIAEGKVPGTAPEE